MNPSSYILPAEEVSPQALAEFLKRIYPAAKSAFLVEHSAWQHTSKRFQYVIQMDKEIVGYSALIPAQVNLGGQVRAAHWWVDLVIAPEARGQGLQSLMDKFIREQADLLLGFPNAAAAKIHRKHGWGVREDLRILLLPLQPARVKSVQRASSRLVRWGAQALVPLAQAWSNALASRRITSARKMEGLDAVAFEKIFSRWQSSNLNTTRRSASYFLRRYEQAPYTNELSYFLADEGYLIMRHLINANGLRHSRVLDLFGNFGNKTMLASLLTLAAQDALRHGAAQITLLSSLPELSRAARRLGFVISAPMRFCWLGDASAMRALAQKNYWTLADSDNDEVE
ncbi:MAG: hypothetical protein Fur002_05460 [Anaerolineales bacterium]